MARNLYPEEIGRASTLTRKVKEAITALKIEAVYTKDEILETYLNTVPFLYNAFGIEMAARTYFDKSADRLDVLESATLIGMLKGTSAYNPVTNPERGLSRAQLVLAQMAKHGKLEPARLEALQKRPLQLDFERQVEPLGPAPHVAQFLRKWLIEWADRKGYNIYADGLVVRTTISRACRRRPTRRWRARLAHLQALADAQRRRGQERRCCRPASWRWTRATAMSRPGWAAAISRRSSSTTSTRRGASRARPSSRSCTAPHSCRGSHPSHTFIDQPVSFATAARSGRPAMRPRPAASR